MYTFLKPIDPVTGAARDTELAAEMSKQIVAYFDQFSGSSTLTTEEMVEFCAVFCVATCSSDALLTDVLHKIVTRRECEKPFVLATYAPNNTMQAAVVAAPPKDYGKHLRTLSDSIPELAMAGTTLIVAASPLVGGGRDAIKLACDWSSLPQALAEAEEFAGRALELM